MINKEDLVIEYLEENFERIKTGIILKGIEDINPKDIVQQLVKTKSPLYTAIIGYGDVALEDNSNFKITDSIEKAVFWRSEPSCAGHILVFIKSDTDKLHSLAEFDSVSTRDISNFLLEKQLNGDNNTPTQNFWKALQDTSDYYTFDALYEFVSAVAKSDKPAVAIPENMWHLNLLPDEDILGTKFDPKDRLAKNRDLIFAIGQLGEDSRKKLSRSLVRTKNDEKDRLQKSYHDLQIFYKYGTKDTLRELDFSTVQKLFSASKDKSKKGKGTTQNNGNPGTTESESYNKPIRSKELDDLVSESVVFGDEEDLENLKDLCRELSDHYEHITDENNDEIPPVGGMFGERNIIIDNNQSDLRILVGKFCNCSSWGGLMKTDETVLKDAISADITNAKFFYPDNPDSLVSFPGGIDGNQSLFDFIEQFDKQFKEKGLDDAERFSPIISELKIQRNKLYANLDMIMYHPVLLFGASETNRQDLINYIHAWESLYHAFCVNEPIMRNISAGGTSFIAKSILLLDVLYVETPKEWKGILLPLHPIYLWRYYEVFRTLPHEKSTLSDEDKRALTDVFSQLPQALSFIIANSLLTGSSEDKVLPCSGNIEMLPTFENKTNRYLGNDGIDCIEDILSRWVGFAPYTKNEIRICSVDAPDLIRTIRQLKSFMDKSHCNRVVYDVYLTRDQNGNTELSKLDYSGQDYEIGEYIKKDLISISVKNVSSANDVKKSLDIRPVHVAFYFDQSSYSIEYGPNSHNLYINPLVITYDYDYDEIQHKGSIFPSSEMDSGLIGDYHKLMKSADVISNNMIPRTTFNGSADMTAVVSTIKDEQVQWLVVADRDTNNYQSPEVIPIGEMQYDKRMVNIWASDQSRIISDYLTLLRNYNLYPNSDTLVSILRQFGHISSNGLISIPKYGTNAQAIENKRKGLLGTLFTASWYTKIHEGDDALVASLDDEKARLWLQNRKDSNERADLIGLYYDKERDVLHIQPIEVKTRDESPDATISRDDIDLKKYNITGHAADQTAYVVEILHEIFATDENTTDMFTSARREVLKYQIVSECFRNVHDSDWQKRWYDILKKAFSNDHTQNMAIDISGILVHIKLNEMSGGEHIFCKHPDFDDCRIDYWKLTSKEIQRDVLGCGTPFMDTQSVDFDTSEDESDDGDQWTDMDEDAIIDSDIEYNYVPVDHTLPLDIPTPYNDEISDVIRAERFEDRQSENSEPTKRISPDLNQKNDNSVTQEEINQLVSGFKRACGDYHVSLRECEAQNTVIGPSVIRLKFRLGRGQSLQGLRNHLEDIGREMKRTGVIIQEVPNSDELMLDVPRLKRELVLFKDIITLLPTVTSPEQLFFPIGRTPNGDDLIEDLGELPHMLVGGSTGSGKSVFLFSMLASLLITHPHKEDMQLVLSSSKLEDFIHFEGLPHLYSGSIISDAKEATQVISDVIYQESKRRGDLLAEARVANITEYNKKAAEYSTEKLAPIVVVIDEFADLADQLETKKEQNEFYKPVQSIAATGRSRGIHLVICTQRPEAKLVPATTKAQLNGRIALRVNDGISSRMIIDLPDAEYLQKHGDMIYRNGDVIERAQGYLIEISELDQIVKNIINQ